MLEKIRNEEDYMNIVKEALREGKIEIPKEVEKLERNKVNKAIMLLLRELFRKRKPVIYPIEVVVVPRYPLSKVPMVKWSDIKHKDFSDPLVNKIKAYTSRIGTAINAAIVGRSIVLVDFDDVENKPPVEVDVKTRRGYHKFFVLKEGVALKMRIGSQIGAKITLNCECGKIEIMSGPDYLISYPLQSRYLSYEGGKLYIRSYRIISKMAFNSFYSSDLTPLKASINDIKEYIEKTIVECGCRGVGRTVEVTAVDKVENTDSITAKEPATSRFARSPLPVISFLSYKQTMELLRNNADLLPPCIRAALFGRVEKGSRYFHLRLVAAVLPFLAELSEKDIEEFVKDFSSRSESTLSDTKQWLYILKYFTGRRGDERAPSLYGVGEEVYNAMASLGYCDRCPIKGSCLGKTTSERRKIIVDYISKIIERTLERRGV